MAVGDVAVGVSEPLEVVDGHGEENEGAENSRDRDLAAMRRRVGFRRGVRGEFGGRVCRYRQLRGVVGRREEVEVCGPVELVALRSSVPMSPKSLLVSTCSKGLRRSWRSKPTRKVGVERAPRGASSGCPPPGNSLDSRQPGMLQNDG